MAFYRDRAAFVVDHDTRISDAVRVVQLTPPGSACSIVIGTGLPAMRPGSLRGLELVVPDMESARSELIARGLDVGEVEVLSRPGRPGFVLAHFEDRTATAGPSRRSRRTDPERRGQPASGG